MRLNLAKLLMSCLLLISYRGEAANFWHQVDASAAPAKLQVMHPKKFLVYTVDEAALKLQLWNLSDNPAEGVVMSIPLPDGTFRDFKVWQTSLMPPALASRYPDIKSFTAEAVDDHRVTAKLDFTPYGFDAMIYDGEQTSFVDPFDNYHSGFYLVHYKRDETRDFANRMKCEVGGDNDNIVGTESLQRETPAGHKTLSRTVNGWNLRTYRLALCADNFYCQAATGLASPTIAQALAKMTISMNRINGVYNREFSVQMNFVSNEDTLIWTVATGGVNGTDPFNTINSNGNACLPVCQTQCTNRIGTANFDLGHVFTTGGGGVSSVGVVCNSTQKGRSVTGSPTPVGDGYDIDYVAHEMGHEFGAGHTFNNNTDGSCAGNRSAAVAYEPGSGSTIMAYAGICAPDDIQPHSDAYFHAASLNDIITKLNGSENACAVATTTGNKLVNIPAFSTSYTIPYKTPFELTAPVAVDSVADTLTSYCWEQWNKGAAAQLIGTFATGPIFRSYSPVTGRTRIFPKNSMVLTGILSNAGVENNQGEKAPDTARYLTFKVTVRDIINGNGCITFPDDTIHLDVVSTGAAANYQGFKVTSQGTTGISYTGGTTQTVTWNVVGTNAAPVSAANVVIYMSRDGGNTWVDSLGTFPNNGSAVVTLPNPAATVSTARIKVKGAGNVFFNVNTNNFTFTHSSASHAGVGAVTTIAEAVKVYPNPASEELHISTGGGLLNVAVYNTLGQLVYSGVSGSVADIQVAGWAKGVYFVHCTDTASGGHCVKSVVIQ